MSALEIILLLVVVALAAALAMTLRARRRDLRLTSEHHERLTEATARAERSEAEKHHARADVVEELANERVARERAQAALHEARLRIAALEQRRDVREEEAGEVPRRSIFRRSGSEVDPHDTEREESGLGRGG